MLDSTAPTAFAPEPEIAWRGVLNESSPPPPPGPRWIQGTVQAQQFSISTTTAVRDHMSSWVRDRAGQTERPSFARDIYLRIQALRVEAEIDQVPFSQASYAEFRDFIRQVPARARPAIFLRDNGNLRALWKNDNQEQIGLQFLGGGDVQYVILKRRPNRKLTTHSGVASRDELLALIRAVGATVLFG
jgi:hypothetical protein